MQQLCKVRHGIIKRYFDKHKYKRSYRNEIIEVAEQTELEIAEIMGDKHVHFMDVYPEIREFMDQANKDRALF